MVTSELSQSLPESLYRSATVRQGESVAAQTLNIPMFALMQAAGAAVFSAVERRLCGKHPSHCHILVAVGKGNNGGDGYVVARLALNAGYKVTLWQVGLHQSLTGDAKRAKQMYVDAGGRIHAPQNTVDEDVVLIVDGLLGTGIQGQVKPYMRHVIERINQSQRPIIAIDTPSGLDTDTGRILGCAIQAELTVTFIAVKLGTVTGQARRCVGQMLFAGLGIDYVFAKQNAPSAQLSQPHWLQYLTQRQADSHKGSHGKLLLVGGGQGMSGAAYLAAAGALRSGVGLAAVVCHQSSCLAIRTLLPEAMVTSAQQLQERLTWSSVICLGTGLGRDDWGEKVFARVAHHKSQYLYKPMVMDADGLHWLCRYSQKQNCQKQVDSTSCYQSNKWQNIVITPHPGEAAQLLDCDIEQIEADRYQAIQALCDKYHCITVLKGAGTLISDGTNTVVCHAGNAGMATGGMGDVLAGVISALLGQGHSPMQAATLGTVIHSLAADDNAGKCGQVGMLASDILPSIRTVLNSPRR